MSEYGSISIGMIGIQRSPIVDRVIASIFPFAPSTTFYALELRWNQKEGMWLGTESRVAPGRYSLAVDAVVEGVWLWEPDEMTVEIEPGSAVRVSFRLEDKIRLGKRFLHSELLQRTDPRRMSLPPVSDPAASSGVLIAMGKREFKRSG